MVPLLRLAFAVFRLESGQEKSRGGLPALRPEERDRLIARIQARADKLLGPETVEAVDGAFEDVEEEEDG